MNRETKKFPIEDIVRDASCQSRAVGNPEVTDDYAAHLRAGGELPPVEVFLVGGVPYVTDGFHRLDAHIGVGTSFVRCVVVGTGTLAEAGWRATAANQAHGLRRTNADKRKAVRNALTNPIGAEQSSRVVAEHVGVSHELVASIRREIEARDVSDSDTSAGKPNDSVKRRDSLGRMQPDTKPSPKPARPESRVELDAEPVWTPPTPKARPLDETPTATPREDCRTWLEAADVLMAARLRCKALLPAERFSRVEAALRAEERLLRASVPVVCPECHGAGCQGCQRRGWVPAGHAREVARA